MTTTMRRVVAAIALLAFFLPGHAQQRGTVQFDIPDTGGAPSGYRLNRDGTLVGAVTPGQTLAALFPSNTGTWVIGVEAFNATGPGQRVNKSVTIGVPAPGPVRNLTIRLNCVTTSPPDVHGFGHRRAVALSPRPSRYRPMRAGCA